MKKRARIAHISLQSTQQPSNQLYALKNNLNIDQENMAEIPVHNEILL